MSICCSDEVVVKGIYKPLNQRLLDFGNEVYKDCETEQRVIMWVFSFYDPESTCKACKNAFDTMYNWFNQYGLTNDPVHGVRMVVEDEPNKNLIYMDLGINKLPMHIFTDSKGKIFDIIYEFPEKKWLDEYILPYIQADSKLITEED